MVTHPFAKPHKPFAKPKKPFAKPHKPFAKQKGGIPLLTLARLLEIRQLVEVNNRSQQSTEMVICQIYIESGFNKYATTPNSSARGLMQLLRAPVAQIYQNRYEEENGKIQTPELLRNVHKQGEAFHDSPQMFDEATNIQFGTEYLQYLIDRYGLNIGYERYRGAKDDYYSKIKACAIKLKQNPNSIQPFIEMSK